MVAKIRNKKKRVVRVSKAANKLAEQKGFGGEPAVGTNFKDLPQIDYITSLNWYARFLEYNEVEDYVAVTMALQGYDTKQIAAAKRSKKLTPTLAAISRLLQRECVLSDSSADWYKDKIDEAVRVGESILQERHEQGQVISIHERTENKAATFIADIDDIIDDVWQGKQNAVDIKMFDVFTQLDIKPAHAKILQEHYGKIVTEMKDHPKDFNRSQYKKSLDIHERIVEALDAWSTNKQTPNQIATDNAKPRTRQQKIKMSLKKETQALTSIKYKPMDNDSGLVSAKPSSILGAQILITYNAKYKVITMYRAKNSEGLSIKGTTIINYDEQTSQSKRAGRSLDTIKEMYSASKTQLIKLFQSLKGTEVELRGRTSDETILVRVQK